MVRDSPLIVGLEHQGAVEANGAIVREDADNISATLDLAVSRSGGLVEAIWVQCSRGKSM